MGGKEGGERERTIKKKEEEEKVESLAGRSEAC